VCEEPGCAKRFWTAQQLRVHCELHKGEKPFKCTEDACDATFLKHHQLREHMCSVHAPPGTKPYRCPQPGCDRSFSTNQHLRTHSRTHDDKRYTCVNPTCLTAQDLSPVCYPTWTALQHHVRTAHPPMCPHPRCKGKTFTAQQGLRAHLKLHEQCEIEEGLDDAASDTDSAASEPPTKKRRGGEIGRDWLCDVEGCSKAFKSKKALVTHRKVNHEDRRDHVCPHETCRRAFGYKHLLQRHLAKLHAPQSEPNSLDEGDESLADENTVSLMEISDITGKTYRIQSKKQVSVLHRIQCPHPDLQGLLTGRPYSASNSKHCEYVFSRSYDLRRHLRSEHDVEVEKERVDRWVQEAKTHQATSV